MRRAPPPPTVQPVRRSRRHARAAAQCFLNLEEKWAPVRDVRAVTGRRYLLTPYAPDPP